MQRFEEVRRIDCRDGKGRRVVVIEQKKWPRFAFNNGPFKPLFEYLTEDGQVVDKLDADRFFLLMSDEIIRADLPSHISEDMPVGRADIAI